MIAAAFTDRIYPNNARKEYRPTLLTPKISIDYSFCINS
jgi:hypothetical protein